MKNIERRNFIKKAAIAAAGSSALVSACGKTETNASASVQSTEKFEWKMVTAWPPHFPILGEGADYLASQIEKMSGGRLKIHVYGGGELVPALEAFDAVSQGSAEMGHCASYYWAGKAPAAQFFTSIPFGMNTQETNAWLEFGGGYELWKEVYDSFNLIPFAAGNTGIQMGGWFNKEIKSVDDLKGLKMRMPGIGGKVITKAGASAILSAGGEIYTNLERGVIDATDWVGPYHDYLMGFHKVAKYYYYPSWAEATGISELIVNKSAYNTLPEDLKAIVKTACNDLTLKMLAEFDTKNAEYIQKIKDEGKVVFKRFPDDVLTVFKEKTEETLAEMTESDPLCKKVYDSYKAFQIKIRHWTELG